MGCESVRKRPETVLHSLQYMTPPEYFALLANCVASDRPLPDDLRQWLGEAVRCYHAGATLDHCFALTEAHRRRWRDRALTYAAQHLAPNQRPWTQAEKLSRAVDTFAWSFWAPRLPAAWPDLSGSRLHLARAFASGLDVPRSQRQLHTILTANQSAFISENLPDTSMYPITATG